MRTKKTKDRLSRTGLGALAEERLRLLRENKKAPTISALMRSLKHVKSSGPYTRDEMNERYHSRLVAFSITPAPEGKIAAAVCGMSEDMP